MSDLNIQGNTSRYHVDSSTVTDTDDTGKTKETQGTTTVDLTVLFKDSEVDKKIMEHLLDMDMPGNQAQSHLGGAVSRFDGLSKAMTDVFQLMELIHQLSNEQKKSSREARQAERDMQYAELDSAVDKMKEAARAALGAAIAGGVFSIVQGGVSIGSGASGLSKLKNLDKPDSLPPGVEGPLNKPKNIDLEVQKITNMGRIGDGVGSVTGGIGQMVSGGMQYQSSMAQAAQKEHEAEAQKAETRAQSETDFMQNLQDVIRDVQNKLQAIQQSNAEAYVKASAV